MRLGQDAVRGEHCGERIAGAYLLGDFTTVMRGALRGKIELSSDAKKVSILLRNPRFRREEKHCKLASAESVKGIARPIILGLLCCLAVG